eukprot:GHVS01025580.1.p1 GENE.GHVS01025580.1~~GHVS01025580.1.p1  ORF type:complete len:199 (+),score=28.65 GHVS01025580.1:202-798(+)
MSSLSVGRLLLCLLPLLLLFVCFQEIQSQELFSREVSLLSTKLTLNSLSGSKTASCLKDYITSEVKKKGYVEFHNRDILKTNVVKINFRDMTKKHVVELGNTDISTAGEHLWTSVKFYCMVGGQVFMEGVKYINDRQNGETEIKTDKIEIEMPVTWTLDETAAKNKLMVNIEQKYYISLGVDFDLEFGWSIVSSGRIY